VAGALQPNGDVVIRVPPLGLLPPDGELVAKPSGGALAQALRARLFHVQALVDHFLVVGHDESSG
jgi:hypothetical protein